VIPPYRDDRAVGFIFDFDLDGARTRALFRTPTLDLARVLVDVDFGFAPSNAKAAVTWGTSNGPG
jgi:hypothetical protein